MIMCRIVGLCSGVTWFKPAPKAGRFLTGSNGWERFSPLRFVTWTDPFFGKLCMLNLIQAMGSAQQNVAIQNQVWKLGAEFLEPSNFVSWLIVSSLITLRYARDKKGTRFDYKLASVKNFRKPNKISSMKSYWLPYKWYLVHLHSSPVNYKISGSIFFLNSFSC
jgi:hypothetical protein